MTGDRIGAGTETRTGRRDRALSDLVGFVLVFGIILTGVGATLALGQGQLSEVKNDEQLRNADRALVLLAQQFDEIESGRADVRTGRLKTDRGTLRIGDRTPIRVIVNGSSGTLLDTTLDTRTLEYTLDGTTIAYESGAVIRRPEGGTGVVRARPQVVCTDDRAFVSVVTLDGTVGNSISGGTGTVTARVADRTVVYPLNRTGSKTAADARNVTVEFGGLSGDSAWSFLADDGNWEQNDARYWCDGVESAYVRQTVLDVSLSI
jgi:hypothetical protein